MSGSQSLKNGLGEYYRGGKGNREGSAGYRKIQKTSCMLAAVMLAAGVLSGCGKNEENPAKDSLAEVTAERAVTSKAAVLETENMFTDRDVSGEYDSADAACIQLDGESLTITEEGIYILSGRLEDGMIIVDGDESAKIQLVLNNVEISNSRGAAIYVRQADKVFITLPEGTTNILSGGDSYESLDDNHIDGIIFAKSDLVINGAGSLFVTAVTGHGIVSKDDLKVTGGSITVTASGHGLSGKDSVRIGGGTLSADSTQTADSMESANPMKAADSTKAADFMNESGAAVPSLHITSGKDGIHSENADKEDKGFIYIAGGSITIASEGDCISADAYLQIDGGSLNLTAGKGSVEKTAARDQDGSEISTKGIKAAGGMILNEGSFTINSQDDALHSDSSLYIAGGSFEIAAGDDGLHAEKTVTVAGGTIDITTCYEGIEGKDVVISGGSIRLYATDDGLNAAGEGSSSILISGGTLYVNADGDGIDSNGDLKVTGGEIYISGPESNADGAIDYEGTAQITGGRLMAVGSSGMAMNFGESSTQGTALINTVSCKAGTEVSVTDEAGNVLLSYTAESGFNSLVVSCPEMVQGGKYMIHVGSEEYEITLEELVYGKGFGGFGGGMRQRPGRPEDGERPEIPEDGEWPRMPGNGERPGMQSGFGEVEPPEMPGNGERPGMPGDRERPEWPEDGEIPEMQSGFGEVEPPEMPENGERL